MEISRRRVLTTSGSLIFIGSSASTGSASEEKTRKEISDLISGVGRFIYNEKENNPNFLGDVTSRLLEIEQINVAKFENKVGNTSKQLRRTEKVVEVLNEDLNVDIPKRYINSISRMNSSSSTINKCLPVVAAGQNCIEAAENYQEAKETGQRDKIRKAKEDLFISFFLLACHVIILQSSTTYKLSFRGTRYAANRGLVYIRKYMGNRVYALILSEVHWAIRGTLNGVISTIVDRSKSIVWSLYFELDSEERRELQNIKESLDYDFLKEESKANESDDSDSWFSGLFSEDSDSGLFDNF